MYKFRKRSTQCLALIGLAIIPLPVWAQSQDTAEDTVIASSVSQSDVNADIALGTEESVSLAAQDTNPEEMLAWQAVLISGDTDEVFAFIQMYPNGPYTKEAKALMIDLLWTDLSEAEQAKAIAVEETPEAEPASAEVEIVTALPTGEIELQSVDGLVAVTGVITAYDDALITIKTTFGTVGIENDGIACIGATCPTALLAAP